MKRKLLCLWVPGVALLFALNAGAQAIIQIASADAVSFFVKSDGSLWRGDREHAMAKLGQKFQRQPRPTTGFEEPHVEIRQLTTENFEPVDLIASNGVTAVTMNGQGDTFFIKNDGSLWAMGNNRGGYLGDGTSDTPEHPIQIVSSGVVAVAGGEMFTLFLKNDGSVWGFGWNGDGPLGDGTDNTQIMTPKQLIPSGVVAIATGYGFSLFIKSDGSLWGTGNNGYGELGLGDKLNHTLRPVQIVASNVVSVVAGARHTLFVKSDGSLWGMGLNDWGQIGDCTIDWPNRPEQIVSSNVVAATAGYSGSLFLKQDGSLWGMGINWGSDYGEGIEFHSKCPTQIFAASSPALVAGYYYNAQLKTCVRLWAGKFNNPSPAGTTSANDKAGLPSSFASSPGSNLITIEQLKNGDVRLTYSGDAGVTYALERSSSLRNPNWVSQVTNKAPSGGVLVITNTPDITANNFWRIRSVP